MSPHHGWHGPQGQPPQGWPPQGQQGPQWGPTPPPQKQGLSGERILLGVVLIPIILFSAWYVLKALNPSGSSSAAGPSKYLADPAAAVRSPQVVTDEEMVVSAGGAQSLSFTLPSERPVKVTVRGVRDTAKGYNVYLMKDEDWSDFKAHRQFNYFEKLSYLKTGGFEKTATLPPGRWNIVVHNSENILNDMSVHIKVVVDPD